MWLLYSNNSWGCSFKSATQDYKSGIQCAINIFLCIYSLLSNVLLIPGFGKYLPSVSFISINVLSVLFCGFWFADNLEKKTSILKASLSCAVYMYVPAKLKKQDWWFSLICMNYCPFTIYEFWLSYFACIYYVRYGFRRV